MSLRPPAEQSAQESTQPISAEVGPLNVATSCGEDTTGADTTGDAATIRPAVVLTEEQINVLEKVKKGGNVFFTGSAGTGKTVLLGEIIQFLKSTRRRVAITASTGIASINIGGTTLHSWAGIGLGEGTAENLSRKIRGTERLRKRWLEVDSLIIDEISMISAGLFDKLVSLHVIFIRTALMPSRRRLHERLDLVNIKNFIRTRLGAFSSLSLGTSASCRQFQNVNAE
ncbi:PIF1-like helicase-domain-containing protein [Lactarius hengduanensis]|nr:PIF1-like helicase-domain-containing protein [Lactarius hengduanensis]